MTTKIQNLSVPETDALTSLDIELIEQAINAVAWKNRVRPHLHPWAVVIVIDHTNLDPVDMFTFGQHMQRLNFQPQVVQFGAADGSRATALIIQRQSPPSVPFDQLTYFLRQMLSGA